MTPEPEEPAVEEPAVEEPAIEEPTDISDVTITGTGVTLTKGSLSGAIVYYTCDVPSSSAKLYANSIDGYSIKSAYIGWLNDNAYSFTQYNPNGITVPADSAVRIIIRYTSTSDSNVYYDAIVDVGDVPEDQGERPISV